MKHLRQLQYCASGVRTFFKQHQLDYTQFLSHGMDAQVLLDKTQHDAMAQAAVQAAEAEHGR